MNNRELSIIVIFSTIICVCIMLLVSNGRCCTGENTNLKNKSKICAEKNNNMNLEGINEKKNKHIIQKYDKDENNKNLTEDVNFNKNKRKVEKIEDISTDEVYKKGKYNKYFYIENEGIEEDMMEVPVFKVSTNVIRKELTFKDKQKLLVMASKLSSFDYCRIKKDLYCPDAEEGVKDALLLARERLSEKDYEKVKKILDRFINIDAIENEN